MKAKFAILIALSLVLAGCNLPASPTSVPATSTPAPRPTVTDLPPVATPTLVPATATATPSDGTLPAKARIVLLEPGSGSAVTSPLIVRGESDPTFEQGLGLKITGEDGTIIGEAYTIIEAELGTRGPFEASVPFVVDHRQSGRVSVFDVGARDGGLLYLTSAFVTLQPAGGITEILTLGESPAFFRIDQPEPFAQTSGGVLHVEGLSGPVFENGIMVALCGEGGIGERDLICGTVDNLLLQVPVTTMAPDAGQPGKFSVDLPYSVSQETFARIAIYAVSPMDGGVIELNSIEIILLP
jgi:hypothetical protein